MDQPIEWLILVLQPVVVDCDIEGGVPGGKAADQVSTDLAADE